MEDDVVLADEVDHAGVGGLPPGFPVVGADVDGVGNVPDGCVEPDVEDLAVGSFYGDGDSPVEVARDGAGLEAHVEPGLALAVYVGAPLFVAFEDPPAQAWLPLVQGEVPVGGLLHDGGGAAQGRLRIYEVGGVEGGAAGLALVAVGALVAAVGAGAGDVAVGQELPGFGVVELLGGFFYELSFFIQTLEEVGGGAAVCGGGGAPVDVEGNAELGERLLNDIMVPIHDVLWGDSLLAGLYGDGHAVLVAAADEQYVAPLQTQVAGVDVGGHIDAGQVTDVHGAVGVGQRGGDERAVELFLVLDFFHRHSFRPQI